MKKLFKLFIILALFFATVSIVNAESQSPCQPIWDDVAGQVYILTIEDQEFEVVFSGSGCGPCPQGIVEIYDGIYISPILECRYVSRGMDAIVLDCNGTEINFTLKRNRLIVFDPNALYMERKVEEVPVEE